MILSIIRFPTLYLLVFCLYACKREDAPIAAAPPPSSELELLNQSYGMDSLQKMDIYLPKGRTEKKTHLMVFIHGGGWMGGDKSEYTSAIEGMKGNVAYAYVTINYRLVKDTANCFPAAEEDVNAAMNYLWAHADSFQISAATALIGSSAGGQLAMLQAYKHNEKGNIKVVVSALGVYDFRLFYEEGSAGVPELCSMIMGGTPAKQPALYTSSSPLTYASPKSPPTFMAHGRLDTLVRIDQGIEMDSILKKKGVPHTLYVFNGYHGFPTSKVANDAASKIFAFISKYLK